MENIVAQVKKLEKEKSLHLEKLEQLQFRKGIAMTRKAEISEQIKTVNNFKTEKESNRTLVMRRVETRQAQFDDLKHKIAQCRAGIERNQEDLNQQCERQFDMIGELEEATIGLSLRMSRCCAVSIGKPEVSQEFSQLDLEIQEAVKLNRQLKEKLRESSQPTGVEELSLQPRCDFAVNAFKEATASIETEIEKIKGLINVEEEEEVEMQEAGKETAKQ